jgi:LmbE family N-acetylglucosaminyl deacetylase
VAVDDHPARAFGFVSDEELARPVVISPHLDDAVLSCGRFLGAHPGSTVITMFAASPAQYTDPLNEWDTTCGFQLGDDTMAVRRAEDTAAMAVLGATPVWLDYHQQSHVARDAGGAHWPDGVLDALADAVAAARPTAVVQPLGLSHPDHECCSEIALALRDRVLSADAPSWFAYEDHPYRVLPSVLASRLAAVARRGIVLTPTPVPTDVDDARAWRAFECYSTQVDGLDADWDLRSRRGQPEGYWRLDDPSTFAHLAAR